MYYYLFTYVHKTSLVDVLKEFLVKSFYEKHDKETLNPIGLWIKVTRASDETLRSADAC